MEHADNTCVSYFSAYVNIRCQGMDIKQPI